MFRRILLVIVVLMGTTIGLVGIVRAVEATSNSPWVDASDPTLQVVQKLPDNILPSSSNNDCIPQKVKIFGSSNQITDCLVTVPAGQMGSNGVIFAGSGESIPVVPQWPHFNLQPIPNQSLTMTYSSGPSVGLYVHFYRSYRAKMSSLPEYINGGWQYTIRGAPDFSLRGADNKLLPVNSSTLAFSPNGSWMVTDLPWQGFVRINLATFEMLPFAPSMQQGQDYSDQQAQLAISNDGRHVVVKPRSYDQFKVYDLQKCDTVTTLPVAPGKDRCASRDYMPYVKTHIANFRGIYKPRFMNSDQISLTVLHDFVSGADFKSSNYTLTAPGQPVSGIQYLGMGDSFASGEGAYTYTDGTDTTNNTCHLSSRAYAYLISSQLFSSGRTVACSGAKTEDIIDIGDTYNGQVKDGTIKIKRDKNFLSSVLANYTPGFLAQTEFVDKYRPDTVTLSIGGNDIGFGDIIKNCVKPSLNLPTCYPTYEDRLELYKNIGSKFNRLVSTYSTVAEPGKKVYIIGYPQIVKPDGNCALNVHLSANEIDFATDLTDYLNAVIKQAADKAGVRYVDVSQALAGHRLCEARSGEVAVNGLTGGNDIGFRNIRFLGNESYHPNALGHELLARAILGQTDNLRAPMPFVQNTAVTPATPLALNSQNVPKTGRPLRDVTIDSSIAPDVLIKNQSIPIQIAESTAILQPNTTYKIVVDSAENAAITVMSDASGILNATLLLPPNIISGLQNLHIYGPNMLGQPIDINKSVYIADNMDDYDGDGILNSAETCILVPPSGQDSDGDSIDDACDPDITLPTKGPWKISGSVTLTQNTITLTKPLP